MIQTDKDIHVTVRRPDLLILDKEKNVSTIADFSFPQDARVEQ